MNGDRGWPNDRASDMRWRQGFAVACLALALVLLALAQTSAGKTALRNLGLYASSEPYSELYFAHPAAVAGYATGAGRAGVTFGAEFVVVNKTHEPRRYRWIVSVRHRRRASGTAMLKPGSAASFSVPVRTGCPQHRRGKSPSRVLLSVSLARAELIDAWLTCRG